MTQNSHPKPPAGSYCQWWALCDNPATTTRVGPLLGPQGQPGWAALPICDRCAAKHDRLEASAAADRP